MPSLLDPSVCPEGKHVIHVYSSGGEPYEPWEKLTPGSPEYEAYKEDRAQVLWKAVERAIPDIRERAEFHIIGSPLAHEAFLRRDRGTYGMAWAAGTAAPYAGLVKNLLPFPFPDLKTPVDGLLRCGDSCFPRHRDPERRGVRRHRREHAHAGARRDDAEMNDAPR